MCAGVGLFGTFSGFLAAWFLETPRDSEEDQIAELRKEIQALREQLTHERGKTIAASQNAGSEGTG